MRFRFRLRFTWFLTIVCSLNASKDVYNEKLFIKPLPEGQLLGHFEFTTLLNTSIDDVFWVNHFNFFPLSLGKFISATKIQEFHFSLTKGLWKNNIWGYAPRDAPTGAELVVLFQNIQDNPTKAWRDVTSTLSGHFCASLNFIDKAATVQPVYSFRPEGVTLNGTVRNDLLFYAALPHEAVCTENLTPWKKFLPCFDKAGLSSLLNAKHVLNSNYFSLALDFKPICESPSCKRTQMQLTQTVSVVFNPPAMFDGKKSWSLIKLFGTPVKESCELATESKIYVEVTRNDSSNPHSFTSSPTEEIVEKFGEEEERKFAVFDVKKILKEDGKANNRLNIVSMYKKNHVYWVTIPPPVFASRYITGYGVSQGGIACHIYNKLSQSVPIIYLDIIPWYLRIYIHTLNITVSRDLSQVFRRSKSIEPQSFFYKPGRDRSQPHHIEMGLTLPPNSVTTIHYSFDRQYLKWTEYPPDANHGVYVDAAVISIKLPTAQNVTIMPNSITSSLHSPGNFYFIRIHTESLLVSLATPDFSMPYNVICLVSTVVSLAFGPIHNLTTRRAQIPKKEDEASKKSLLSRVKNFFSKKKNESSENNEIKETETETDSNKEKNE